MNPVTPDDPRPSTKNVRSTSRHDSLATANVGRHWIEVRRADETRPATRMILALHGSNQTPASFRRAGARQFERSLLQHPDESIVVVYPASWRRGLWNDARRMTRSRARQADVDDVLFLRTLAERYRGEGVGRVDAIGFSNGGQMVIRLLLDAPGVVDGAVLIGATLPVNNNLLLPMDGARAVPMVIVHGTRDGVVPFRGGMASLYGISPRGEMRSFEESVAAWRRLAGHGDEPEVVELQSHRRPGFVSHRSVFSTPGLPTLLAVEIGGGGHFVPRDVARPAVLGRVADEVDIVREMQLAGIGEAK